jgi:hypothetical protein
MVESNDFEITATFVLRGDMRDEDVPYFCAIRVLTYYNVQKWKYGENNGRVVNWLNLNKNSAYKKNNRIVTDI